MNTIIKVEKSDIVTSRLGYNIQIQIDEKTSLVFTQDALEELFKDYAEIKEEIARTDSSIVESIKPIKIENQLSIPFDDSGN